MTKFTPSRLLESAGLVRAPRRDTKAARRWTRRGVVSVLSMMFLILFGSLAAAMAIMSKGNVTTAATHQHVQRAMGAAETGLRVAEERLREAAGRFVVSRGEVDAGFGRYLWASAETGVHPTYGEVQVVAPKSYADTSGSPRGIIRALMQIHDRDAAIIVAPESGNLNAPAIRSAPSGADLTMLDPSNWLITPIVAMVTQPAPDSDLPPRGTGFQIEYIPMASGTEVRVAVTGYDFDYTPGGQAVSRRITQDFALAKRVDAAILSPSKVMIGKNVLVEGDIGATFTGVTFEHGDPLIVRSDFWGIDAGLNAELTKLNDALAASDLDKDNRLRVGHPTEGPAIPDFASLQGFTHTEDGVTITGPDVTRDGYVDEFDVFMMYYDGRNGGVRDGRVALHSSLSAGTPFESLSPEFVTSGGISIDSQLALLIDSSNPDRNRNGEFAFIDRNSNGVFDPPATTNTNPDELVDQEVRPEADDFPPSLEAFVRTSSLSTPTGQACLFRDQVLGYRDGVIDRRDQYAKVRGRTLFRTTSTAWQAARGNFMSRIQGPIKPPVYQAPMQFNVGQGDLPEITATNFTTTRTRLQAMADGASFDAQVASNLGISASQLATWTTANNSTTAGQPRYIPLARDLDRDGLPDNWQTAYFEKMPFNSPNFFDWYYRPVYENMVFVNVVIPRGSNALFRNCVFVGATYVQTETINNHVNWTNYGRMKLVAGKPQMEPPRVQYAGTSFPTMLSASDRPVFMANPPLDKADIPANEVSVTQGYNNLPDPLIVSSRRVINTKELSNNLRFDSCTFYGSIVSDTPTAYTNARNKMQFTGGTKFTMTRPTISGMTIPEIDAADRVELLRSSMMLPQYSVDIGEFNAGDTQDVRLRGAIIAGVLDVRGNANVQGSLILTFKPERGAAPMIDAMGQPVGNPANFNASIGYFGDDDGEEESLDPASLPVVSGQRIVGWSNTPGGPVEYPPTATPPTANPAAFPVPFRGFGQITLRFDPTMALPDGLMLPVRVDALRNTYRETRQ